MNNHSVEQLEDPDQIESRSALRVAWQKGRQAAWENRWPGFFLWLFGIALILGYFFIPQVNSFLKLVGELKSSHGLAFSVVSTAIFGGLLPVLIPLLVTRKIPRSFWMLLMSNCIFWALKGVEIDLFYQLQAALFGDDSNWKTIAKKVFVDQAIYAPFVGLFNCVLFYIWRDNHFSISQTKFSLGKNWYLRKVLPALISNWAVWGPAVILIYNLPLELQLPVQNLILCFWVLMLVFFTTEPTDQSQQSQQTPAMET